MIKSRILYTRIRGVKSIVEIVKQTLKSQVYDYLKKQLILGNIKPGERLVEEKIGQTLKVSRSPIREAIRMLEKDGFLNLTETGGVKVVQPSLADFDYLYECKVEMESAAAYYAAARRTEEQLHDLKQAIDTYRPHQKNEDEGENKNRFHDLVIEASMNPFLISMLQQVQGINSFYRKTIVDTYPKHIDAAVKEHKEIYEAILNQNQELARKLMGDHIKNDYQTFKNLIEEKAEG